MAALHSRRHKDRTVTHKGGLGIGEDISRRGNSVTLTSALVTLLVQTPVKIKKKKRFNGRCGDAENETSVVEIGVFCAPDKLLADGAEGRLREERGAELVTLDDVDLGLFDSPSPLVEGEQTLSLWAALLVSLGLTCSV